jgi:hypothetical protein
MLIIDFFCFVHFETNRVSELINFERLYILNISVSLTGISL